MAVRTALCWPVSADLGVTQRAIEVAWNTTQEAIELVEQRYGTRL